MTPGGLPVVAPLAAAERRATVVREMRDLAVVFADITNSTGLYRKLGDLGAREVVARVLAALADVLPPCDGRLVKTVGDAVMCVFPAAEQAYTAACSMQEAVSTRLFAGEAVSLHIGLHRGPVIVEQQDVFGDTVNAAAYLAAAATRDQILTTEAIASGLSAAAHAAVRPIFQVVLKGATEESTVYQVLWRGGDVEITQLNLHSGKVLPRDTGSLLVRHGERGFRIDLRHPTLTVGRAPDCDLVLTGTLVSRRHATIRLRHTRFHLVDHSSNGTYVRSRGEETQVLRGELTLDDSGELCPGRRRGECGDDVLRFERDRRSLYRV